MDLQHVLSRKGAGRALLPFVVSLAYLAAAPASACGFLDTLFNNCRQSAPPSPGADEPLPPRRPVTRSAEELKQHPIAAPAGAATGSIAHFASDSTLRRGDIVVTPQGFRVFNGRTYDRAADDFTPIGRRQNNLADLEKASRAGPNAWSKAPVLAAKPASAPRVERANAEAR